MRAFPYSIKGVKLMPENEADVAMLEAWSRQSAVIIDGEHGDKGCEYILIEFKEKDEK